MEEISQLSHRWPGLLVNEVEDIGYVHDQYEKYEEQLNFVQNDKKKRKENSPSCDSAIMNMN